MTIVISNLEVVDNAPDGTFVGALTAMDEKGTVIPCNFMLTKQAAGYFGIVSDDLVTAWAGSIKPGNYPVTVRANGITTRFKEQAKFTIIVRAFEPPALPVPTGVKFNPVKTSLKDNAAAGTLVATFSVSTSDGSPFSGTQEASPASTVAIAETTRLVLARNLGSADDGLQQWGVIATQNGVSASGFTQVQVTSSSTSPPPAPPPTPPPAPPPAPLPGTGTKFVTSFTPGLAQRNANGFFGMKITVGSAPLRVQSLGWEDMCSP